MDCRIFGITRHDGCSSCPAARGHHATLPSPCKQLFTRTAVVVPAESCLNSGTTIHVLDESHARVNLSQNVIAESRVHSFVSRPLSFCCTLNANNYNMNIIGVGSHVTANTIPTVGHRTPRCCDGLLCQQRWRNGGREGA